MKTRDYISLHSEDGGPAKGFRCQHCADVTRTEAGMWMHLRYRHNIKIQGDFFDGPAEVSPTESELSQGVDANTPHGSFEGSSTLSRQARADSRGAL